MRTDDRLPDDDPVDPTAAETGSERAPEFVQSLDRGLSVIRAFSDRHDHLSMSDVARTTGLSKASARRFLMTLEALGYVGSRHKRYFLRPRVLDLGYAYLSSTTEIDITQDHLEGLSAEIKESCSACAYDDGEIVYVARAAADRIMSVNISVGRRLPAFATSTGRVLLAALPTEELDEFFVKYPRPGLTEHTITDESRLREIIAETAERGWTVNDQELENGVRSVAAPVRDASGQAVSAVNISVPTSRVSVDELKTRFLPRLLEVTALISRDLNRARRD